jgi:D-alanyl-D-alanine carboxypeptidase
MKYKEFKEISTSKEYVANIVQSDGIIRAEKWLNTNYFVTEELLMSSNVTLEGSKTGNTTKSGSCLMLATREKKSGEYYISIVLNAKSKRNSYYNSNALLNGITK